jgi:hypothetical protein
MIELYIAKLFMYLTKHSKPQAPRFTQFWTTQNNLCIVTDDHHSMHWIPSIFFFNNMGIKQEE